MKKQIFILGVIFLTLFVLYKLVYKPFLWQKKMQSKEHTLQVGSYIFSVNEISNGDTFTRSNYYFVHIVTEIKGDYVRLAAVQKFTNPEDQINSLPSKNDNFYNNLKSTIDTIKFTAVDVDENVINVNKTENILKYYPIVKKQPFYYTVGYANKLIPLDARGNPVSDYFDAVYSKKEIIENTKLVRYDLTNQNNGIPVLYDLGEKIEIIVNKMKTNF
jgi:hypothetical protein